MSTASAEEMMVSSWYYAARAKMVAHKTLPFGTRLDIYNPSTGKRADAFVGDRGPFKPGRSLDVSLTLARKLGFVNKGVTELVVTVTSIGRLTRRQAAKL